MASPDFSDSMPHLHICTLFETTLLHLSVYIETTKCTLKLWTPWPRLSVHIETTDSNGLMCLCILKLRTPRPHLSIETTDSMASSVCGGQDGILLFTNACTFIIYLRIQ